MRELQGLVLGVHAIVVVIGKWPRPGVVDGAVAHANVDDPVPEDGFVDGCADFWGKPEEGRLGGILVVSNAEDVSQSVRTALSSPGKSIHFTL